MTPPSASGSGGGSLPPEWWVRAGTRTARDAALELGDIVLPGGSSSRRRRRRRPSAHADRSLAWRVCHTLLRQIGRSERLQRTGVRIAIAAGLGVVILGGVGVIMLNNVVIKRTAELGQLETERNQLQIDDAADSATIAQLSAPTRIVDLGLHRYGMVESSVMQQFIWLHPRAGEDAGLALRTGDAALQPTQPALSALATSASKSAAKTATSGGQG